ncbi:MAG: NifB/NifX family molybdenum-iron cluster-binding protein [Planctomycetes bacterium]|nr:NifB/NifX family molybdenum-iron cluster-binding protein [Planctomycetota bacterium]
MEPVQAKVAIPRFGETVAPCFEYSATVAIFTIAKGVVTDQIDFTLQSQHALDRVRLLRDQGVDTLICGGVQDRVEDILRANGIRVISWVTGSVDELLSSFIRGRLTPGRNPQEAPHNRA